MINIAYLPDECKKGTIQKQINIHYINNILVHKFEIDRPFFNWTNIWENINSKILNHSQKCIWLKIIHNIFLTHERLEHIEQLDEWTDFATFALKL